MCILGIILTQGLSQPWPLKVVQKPQENKKNHGNISFKKQGKAILQPKKKC